MPAGDTARVSIRVAATPERAFRAFTEEIDLWWRRGVAFRRSGRGPGVLQFERGPGGRLFESWTDASGAHLVVVGLVRIWEPPARLVFEWRNEAFAPHESTEVDVRFESAGEGTLVVLEHRGWSSLRPGHPARHGQEGAAFSRALGLWWADLLRGFQAHAERPEAT